jgi:hypothetical protein
MKAKVICSAVTKRPLYLTKTIRAAGFVNAVGIAICFSAGAQAIDIDAGDYIAAPPGTSLALLYVQHSTRDAFYSNGNKLTGNNKLDADIGILRGIHYFKLGSFTALSQAILPFGKLEGKGDMSSLGDARGTADLILSNALWFKTGDRTQTNWGVAHYLYVPTGSYDKNQALNLGENRWKWTLATGLAQGLTENLSLDLTADVTFYGNNNQANAANATKSQEMSYQTQAHLRYNITPSLHLFSGYSYEWGGETEIDGVSQNDGQKKSKFSVGTGYWVTPSVQLIAAYGRDIKVENGFKEDARINVRLMKAF